MLSHAIWVVSKNKTVTTIFGFLFFNAANIVGQCRKACFAIVFEKQTCTEQNLVFPYLNTPFQEYRGLLWAYFYGSSHNHLLPSCYLLSKYQPPFPSDPLPDWLTYLIWFRAVVLSHSTAVKFHIAFFFFFFRSEEHFRCPKSNIFTFLWLFKLV